MRTNKRKEGIFIPTCAEYAQLLELAHKKNGKDFNEIRKEMANATYAQWRKYLDL